MFKSFAALAAAGACALVTVPAGAATFNTADAGSNRGTMATYAYVENGATYYVPFFQSATVDGISFTARGYASPDLAAGPGDAGIGFWDAGLGVINRNEINVGGNQHTIDNIGSYDFVALYFNKAVSLTGMTLNAFAVDGSVGTPGDKDAWIGFANVGSLSTAAVNGAWNTLLGSAMYSSNGAMPANYAGNANNSTAGKFANMWVIGAARAANQTLGIDVGNDGFKLAAISVQAAPVPEPATWVAMLTGFGIAGAALRRRRASVAFA